MQVNDKERTFNVLAHPLWGDCNLPHLIYIRVRLQPNAKFSAQLGIPHWFGIRVYREDDIDLWKQLRFNGKPPANQDDMFQLVRARVKEALDDVLCNHIPDSFEALNTMWPIRCYPQGNKINLVIGPRAVQAVLADIPRKPTRCFRVCNHVHRSLCRKACSEEATASIVQHFRYNPVLLHLRNAGVATLTALGLLFVAMYVFTVPFM